MFTVKQYIDTISYCQSFQRQNCPFYKVFTSIFASVFMTNGT